MNRKYLNYSVVGVAAIMLVLAVGTNVKAQEKTFNTDKTDRTIIKEILVKQRETHALLKEIKAALKDIKAATK